MIRYGKGKTAQIAAAAKLYLERGKGTHFLCETGTAQTRLQKAIRQATRIEMRKLGGAWDDFFLAGPRVSDDFMSEPMLRPVPVLSNEEELFLDAISRSENFTLEKVLKRHTSALTAGQTVGELSEFVRRRSKK
jgi:hypothetical protein